MATSWIPNQPVKFVPASETDVLDDRNNQLLISSDVSQVQFNIAPCDDAQNVVVNGTFTSDTVWVPSGIVEDWLITGGKAVKGTSIIPCTLSQACLNIGSYYKVTFTVVEYTSGWVDIYVGNTNYFRATEAGTFTFYAFCTGTNNISLVAGPSTTLKVDNVEAVELQTNIILSVWNDGLVTKISYTDNPEYFTFKDDSLTIEIDWSTLGITDNGCYYLGLHTPCTNTNGQCGLYNYDFHLSDGWSNSIGTKWSISGGKAVFSNTGLDLNTYDFVNSKTYVYPGLSYTITYTISGLSAGIFYPVIGGTAGTFRTTNGTFTETIIAGSADSFVRLRGGSTNIFGGSSTLSVDNVVLRLTNDSDLVSNQISNKFKMGDYNGTLVINACNDENGLGFNFNDSGFTPRIRVEGILANAKYPYTRGTNIDSQGKANVYFGQRRKTHKLKIGDNPEYIHDFLSLLPLFDRFYINYEEYFVEDDEYQVSYNDNETDIGSATIEVSQKTQLTRNVNTGAEENNCSIEVSRWIDENGNYVIDGLDDKKVIV